MNQAISREIESTHRSSPRKSIRALRLARSKACRGRDYNPNLEARAVTLYVFRISEHTRITYILFVLMPVLFPLCHVIKSGDKLVASNPLEGLFAAVTDNFNSFDSRVRRGFKGHARSPFLPASVKGKGKRYAKTWKGDLERSKRRMQPKRLKTRRQLCPIKFSYTESGQIVDSMDSSYNHTAQA